MKLLCLAAALFLLSLISGCAAGFCRQDTSGCESRIIGTYLGEARISAKMKPVLTSFYHDDKGKLRGRYFSNYKEYFDDPVHYYVMGEISDIRPKAEFMHWTTWTDETGYGNLRMVWSYDGKEFAGYRGSFSDDMTSSWYGKKVSDKPLLSIEDVREYSGLPSDNVLGWWPHKK